MAAALVSGLMVGKTSLRWIALVPVIALPLFMAGEEGDHLMDEGPLTRNDMLLKCLANLESSSGFKAVERQVHKDADESSENVIEIIQVGRDAFMRANDGARIEEMLVYKGDVYSRGPADSRWERTTDQGNFSVPGEYRLVASSSTEEKPRVSRVHALVSRIRTLSTEANFEFRDLLAAESGPVVRLIGQVPAQQYDLAEVDAELQDLVSGFLGSLGYEGPNLRETTSSHEELGTFTEEVELLMDADTFLPRKIVLREVLLQGGRELASRTRTVEFSSFNEALQLPGPLPLD